MAIFLLLKLQVGFQPPEKLQPDTAEGGCGKTEGKFI